MNWVLIPSAAVIVIMTCMVIMNWAFPDETEERVK